MNELSSDYPLKKFTGLPKYFYLDWDRFRAHWVHEKPSHGNSLCKFNWRYRQNELKYVYLCSSIPIFRREDARNGDHTSVTSLDTTAKKMLNQFDASFRNGDKENCMAISRWLYANHYGEQWAWKLSYLVCRYGVVTTAFSSLVWLGVTFNNHPDVYIDPSYITSLTNELMAPLGWDCFHEIITIHRGDDLPQLIDNLANENQKDQLWSLHHRKDYCQETEEMVTIDRALYGWLIRLQRKASIVTLLTHSEFEMVNTETMPVLTKDCIRDSRLWRAITSITGLNEKIIEQLAKRYHYSTCTRTPLYFRRLSIKHQEYYRVWQTIEPIFVEQANKILKESEN